MTPTETQPQEQPATLPPLLTKREAAQVLRVTERTLERWAASGELTPVRIGGSVRYRPEDIRAAMQRRGA